MLTADSHSAGAIPQATEPAHGRGLVTDLGSVGTSFLASLCCIGPVIFVTLGVGAGLASFFSPLRPLFIGLTLLILAFRFYTVYGRKRAMSTAATGVGCSQSGSCANPRDRRRDKIALWTTTVIAIVLLTFPQWSVLFV